MKISLLFLTILFTFTVVENIYAIDYRNDDGTWCSTERIVGKWKEADDTIWSFNSDGTLMCDNCGIESKAKTWEIKNIYPNWRPRIEIAVSGSEPIHFECVMSKDGEELSINNKMLQYQKVD